MPCEGTQHSFQNLAIVKSSEGDSILKVMCLTYLSLDSSIHSLLCFNLQNIAHIICNANNVSMQAVCNR